MSSVTAPSLKALITIRANRDDDDVASSDKPAYGQIEVS